MKVQDAMCRDVKVVAPNQTLIEAASTMAESDVGILPVAENDRLTGMISDRDIAVRGVARGLAPNSKVSDVMSSEVKYCFEDQDISEVTKNMSDLKVRRLPVVSRDKRLVGILSLGDIATKCDSAEAAKALSGISEPGGQHSQSSESQASGSAGQSSQSQQSAE